MLSKKSQNLSNWINKKTPHKKTPHKKTHSESGREGGENMNVKVELQGLEEVNALLKENRRLTDELMDNIRGLQRTCMLINVREKENQPEAATND